MAGYVCFLLVFGLLSNDVLAQTNGDVRLSGGSWAGDGLLEVYYNGRWGPVCDDNFVSNVNGSMVVCRQLGFTSGQPSYRSATGPGNNFLLDNVACRGTERAIAACNHAAWGTDDCSSSEHVWVSCVNPCSSHPCQNGGTCYAEVHISFGCHCPPSHKGRRCENSAGIDISCGGEIILVQFNKSYFPYVTAGHLSLRDPSCHLTATDGPSLINIRVPLDECGTLVRETDDDFIYENQVYGSPSEERGVISRVRDMNVLVRCLYSKNAHARARYRPNLDVQLTAKGWGNFKIRADLTHDGEVYTPNSTLAPGEALTVSLSLQTFNDSRLQLFARNCTAAPRENDDDDTSVYPLLEKGCQVDPTFTFSDNSNKTAFTFDTFKFTDNSSDVFLRCDVLVCNVSEPDSRCHHRCQESGRKRRDAVEPNLNNTRHMLGSQQTGRKKLAHGQRVKAREENRTQAQAMIMNGELKAKTKKNKIKSPGNKIQGTDSAAELELDTIISRRQHRRADLKVTTNNEVDRADDDMPGSSIANMQKGVASKKRRESGGKTNRGEVPTLTRKGNVPRPSWRNKTKTQKLPEANHLQMTLKTAGQP